MSSSLPRLGSSMIRDTSVAERILTVLFFILFFVVFGWGVVTCGQLAKEHDDSREEEVEVIYNDQGEPILFRLDDGTVYSTGN